MGALVLAVLTAAWAAGCSAASGGAGAGDGGGAEGGGGDATGTQRDEGGALGDASARGEAGPVNGPDSGTSASDAGDDGPGTEAGPRICSDAGPLPLNCAAHPSACCYPDDTNTGVPPGVTLKPMAGGEIHADGTVLDGVDITDVVDIYANNVTIKNSRITVSSSGSFAVAIRPGMTGALIEDTTIRGQDNDLNSVEYAIDSMTDSPVTIRRVNLFNCSECVSGGNVTITDSYIHDTADPPGAHVENIYGYSNVTLRHNTMYNSVGQTAVVYVQGVSDNCEISDNLLAGGGYTIYGGSSSTQDSSNFVIKNNRFSKMYYPASGYYGVDAYFNASGPGDSWTGNFWDDTGQPVMP